MKRIPTEDVCRLASPLAYVPLILDYAERSGGSREKLGQGLGLPRNCLGSADVRVSRHDAGTILLRAIKLTGNPGTGDRKSVVSGKSVSVRVDLGGRRLIKKKKKVYITDTNMSCS